MWRQTTGCIPYPRSHIPVLTQDILGPQNKTPPAWGCPNPTNPSVCRKTGSITANSARKGKKGWLCFVACSALDSGAGIVII